MGIARSRYGWFRQAVRLLAGALLLAAGPSLAQDVPPAARDAVDEAAALKRAGKLVEAEQRLGDALVLAPAYGEAWWLNAWVQTGLQDDSAALLAFQKAGRLLPSDDPRVAQAQAKAVALEAAGVTPPTPTPRAITPVRAVEPPYRPPPPPAGNAWAGWPIGLLSLMLMVCCAAAWLALRADAIHGSRSPEARFGQLCRRLAEGGDVKLSAALATASRSDLAHLPEADRVALVAASAARSAAARDQLMQLVTTASGPRRRLVALALAAQREQPEPGLWTLLLDSEDKVLRQAALRGLANAPDPAAGALLAKLGKGGDPEQAALAIKALDKLGDDPALMALAELAGSAAHPAIREAALQALAGRRRLPRALTPVLTALLDAARGAQRVVVVRALAATGEPAVERLLDALLDADDAIREAARESLLARRAKPDVANRLMQRLIDQPATATIEALAILAAWVPEHSGAVLERVLQANDAAPTARLAAIEHLTAHEADGASSVLLRAFGKLPQTLHPTAPERELAVALATGLAKRGVVESLAPLLERLALHPDEPEWQRAARMLASKPEAGEALTAAVGERAGKIRRLALALLADFPHAEAADALLAELSRADSAASEPEAVQDAAAALGKLGDQRALPPLQTLLERHPELAGDRLDVALALLGDAAAVSRVEAMLVRPEVAARRPAAAYFSGLDPVPPRAAGVVAEATAHDAADRILREADAPEEALAQLGEAVEPTVEAWLIQPSTRHLAAAVLSRLGRRRAPELSQQMDALDALPGTASAAEIQALVGGQPELEAYARARLGEQALNQPEA